MKNINILNNLNSGKTSSYFTINGTKEFTCENAGYVDNVVIEGETLVNLVDYSTLNVEGSNCWTFRLKANTVYTLFSFLDDEDGCTCILNEDLTPLIEWTSDKVYTFLNPIDQKVVPHYNLAGFKMVILEGDHTDKSISYFEGLKSVGQGDNIEVLSYSKNLDERLDLSNLTWKDGYYIHIGTGAEIVSESHCYTTNYIPIQKTGCNMVFINANPHIVFYDENKNVIYQELGYFPSDDLVIVDVPINAKFLRFTGQKSKKNSVSVYYSQYDKKQIPVTLRSLPNGVKDTIEKRGNKYVKVQRCGEVVLNGSEMNWLVDANADSNGNRFCECWNYTTLIKPKSFLVCDTLKCRLDIDSDKVSVSTHNQGIMITQDSRIRIKNEYSNSVDSLKTWLQSNPTTVVFELATPQIIELPNFNPQTYKGDNILLINSGVIQCDASFDVCEGIRSELDVIKDKVSSLDESVKNSLGSEMSNEINTIKNTVNNNTNEINTIKNTVSTVQKTKMTEDHGACRGIPNNNANDIDITGFWMGSNVINAPTGVVGEWIYIESLVHNSLYQVQKATDLHDSSKRWTRHKTGGAWSEWRSL